MAEDMETQRKELLELLVGFMAWEPPKDIDSLDKFTLVIVDKILEAGYRKVENENQG